MKIIRVAAALAIGAATSFLAWRYACLPVVGNYWIYRLERSNRTIEELADAYQSTIRARENLARAKGMIEKSPSRVKLYELAAVNAARIGRYEEAIALLEQSLRYDKRPEILLALGLAQCAGGAREDAVRNLSLACTFDPKLRFKIPGTCLVPEVHASAIGHQDMLILAKDRDLLVNGDFHQPAAESLPAEVKNGTGPSAASGWYVVADASSQATSRFVPSTRRAGQMLDVVTRGQSAGIMQSYGAPNSGASHVVTRTWIYVVRGRVRVGSGNAGTVASDVASAGTGRWERLEAPNIVCPSNQTVLLSTVPDTEFYVDTVSVRAVPGPPCTEAR